MPGIRSIHIAIACLVIASACGDDVDEAAGAPGGGPDDGEVRLVPSEVPDGLVLCFAFDMPELDLPSDETGTAIWADASLDDPWAGPLVGLWTTNEEELPVHDDAVEVTVHGVNGYVAPMPLFQAVSSAEWGHIVTWRDPSGPIIEVAARGASPEEALRLAELVTLGGGGATRSLPSDALGPDTVPIHEGRGVQPFEFATSGWSLQYSPETRSETLEDDDLRLLTITGSAGEPQDLRALRFWAATTEPVEIRGEDGLAYGAFDAEGGPFGIAWSEGGLIV